MLDIHGLPGRQAVFLAADRHTFVNMAFMDGIMEWNALGRVWFWYGDGATWRFVVDGNSFLRFIYSVESLGGGGDIIWFVI